ncbi:hypothetical protein L202_08437 [Cryptococcus amylolentus CBS 6039]|uniref:Uncharacterized protein n=1 Tax=Cryptococcus amylolentus CBS 6039 TaxID=1295533 RepID=A0A1E3H9K9_9TREE|nr:hypothetical protein L202_08437 [Cryptococcus amylolentus CBS 6039]ODN73042.1 hypothetical protein L202_08437 [Cryptococcus amylolentus CBS 6039]
MDEYPRGSREPARRVAKDNVFGPGIEEYRRRLPAIGKLGPHGQKAGVWPLSTGITPRQKSNDPPTPPPPLPRPPNLHHPPQEPRTPLGPRTDQHCTFETGSCPQAETGAEVVKVRER